MSSRTPDSQLVRPNEVFPVLDTLRLVGALAVLTTHVAFQTGGYLRNGTWGSFTARLDVGVAIFFVLSGFLLSRPYLISATHGRPRPDTKRYAEKRVLRIMPVYVVTVVLALLLAPGNDPIAVGQWLSSLFLLDPYHLSQLPHGLTHMWSLTAEVAFYVVLPILMLAVRNGHGLSGRRTLALISAMILVSLVWHTIIVEAIRHDLTGAPGIWLPAYLTWFALGIGLAYVHVRHKQGNAGTGLRLVVLLGSQPGTCWAIALGLVLVASTPIAGPIVLEEPTAGESLAKHVVYAFIGGLTVMSGVFAQPGGAYARAMSWGPLRHLGHISYSIFCIHMLILIAFVFPIAGVNEFSGHGLRVWLVTMAVTLLASEALYRAVELPALRLKGRLKLRWRGDDPGATEATTASAPHEETTTR